MKINLFILSFIIAFNLFGQIHTTYQNKDGKTHLCGAFDISTLESDTIYNHWFEKYYNSFELPENENVDWKSNLENYTIEIYLGTWCGDSKYWVPRFIKLWDDLKLDRNKLKFIALYDTEDKYKIGPNGEEKGKLIHRVPTFIFKSDNVEQARIVESPVNNLITDIAQIALGYPSKPNYRAANFAMHYFENTSIDDINDNYDNTLNILRYLAKRSKTLNTLGYVFLKRKDYDKALLTFKLNSEIFIYEPNVFDSYGEALAKSGKNKEAIIEYKKVLKLDPLNQHAKEQIKLLKK